jgi:hypothetical protein
LLNENVDDEPKLQPPSRRTHAPAAICREQTSITSTRALLQALAFRRREPA